MRKIERETSGKESNFEMTELEKLSAGNSKTYNVYVEESR